MHNINISALFLATTAAAAAGRTFFNVPVGLDKSAVSEAFFSHGIQGFDPNAQPNANGLYAANSLYTAANNHNIEIMEKVEPEDNQIESLVEQPIMLHPVAAAMETVADVPPPFPQSAPKPASIIASPHVAAMSGPPPGRPVAVPLAPAHEPRPGLLVAPPVVVGSNAQIPAQAIRPNPPTMPLQPPPPPPPRMITAQPAVTAAPPPLPPMPAPAVSAAKAVDATVAKNNGVLTSTVLVMATVPRPQPQSATLSAATSSAQPVAVGKSGAMAANDEDDESEDEASSAPAAVTSSPTLLSSTPQQAVPPLSLPLSPPLPPPSSPRQQPVAHSQSSGGSESIASAPTGQLSSSASPESTSSAESKPAGPVKLKPLMFAKANMSVFKPEDLDKFTFPSAELSVNMAGLGRESSASLHSKAATGFEGSMPNSERAKPTAAASKASGNAAKATGGTASDAAGAASTLKAKHQQGSQASESPASLAEGASRGDKESSAVSAMQQNYVGAAVLLAVIIHIAVAAI
ncbi:hypothetical protein IWW37_004545 [Coemansia sp. RSA 2050]|nr:hypothetical protein IWW37_004545 [Coemansia sp. RSA 2050]KAJ2731646.1 hypothetical protein IW152_004412 [Coemansia sp. BCRC 34962]